MLVPRGEKIKKELLGIYPGVNYKLFIICPFRLEERLLAKGFSFIFRTRASTFVRLSSVYIAELWNLRARRNSLRAKRR